jgi:hypothetical protein
MKELESELISRCEYDSAYLECLLLAKPDDLKEINQARLNLQQSIDDIQLFYIHEALEVK